MNLRTGTPTTSGPGARAAFSIVAMTLVVLASGCEAPPFDYRNHEAPRVSVIHRPLNPGRGDPVEVIARADPGLGGGIASVHITFLAATGAIVTRTCLPGDLRGNECTLSVDAEVPAGEDHAFAVYSARMEDDEGRLGRSPSGYLFQIGATGSAEGVAVPLRVPFDLHRGRRGFKILLVANEEDYARLGGFDFGAFKADLESLLYEQLLEDPAYRWRDDQLGFYGFSRPGVTTDYDSGDASRCGQNPWPGLVLAETGRFDALGVIAHAPRPRARRCGYSIGECRRRPERTPTTTSWA